MLVLVFRFCCGPDLLEDLNTRTESDNTMHYVRSKPNGKRFGEPTTRSFNNFRIYGLQPLSAELAVGDLEDPMTYI